MKIDIHIGLPDAAFIYFDAANAARNRWNYAQFFQFALYLVGLPPVDFAYCRQWVDAKNAAQANVSATPTPVASAPRPKLGYLLTSPNQSSDDD